MKHYDIFNVIVNVDNSKIQVDFTYFEDLQYPITKSLSNFLGIDKINDIDIEINENTIAMINVEKEYSNNYEALVAAAKIKEALIAYNALLKEIEIPDYTVYKIEFEPNGKEYLFKSNDELKENDIVITYSKNKVDYGIVRSKFQDNPHLYEKRSICKLYGNITPM